MSHLHRVSLMPVLCTCLLVLAPLRSDRVLPDNKIQIASALLCHFETVFYAKGELLASPGGYRDLSKEDSNSLRAPFAYLISGLAAAGPQISRDVLRSDEVFVGATDFLPPSGLGSVHFQYCYVIVLDSPEFLDLRTDFKSDPFAKANGSPVWHWTAKLGEFGENDPRASSFYITQTKSHYVLVSNDLSDLRIMAQQLSVPDGTPSLIPLREWEFVTGHEVWGYRPYRQTGTNRASSGRSDVASDAQAFIFTANAEEKVATLRLIASDQRPADKFNADAERMKARLSGLHAAGAGVWETTFTLSGDRLTAGRLFEIMGLLGFGAYL